MMAGAYLDAETTRDEMKANHAHLQSGLALKRGSIAGSLSNRLAASGLSPEQSAALTGAVEHDREALGGLLLVLEAAPEAALNPWEQALWMLLADFLAAAVPILPFVLLPIPQARVVSAVVTTILLVALGIGRAQIAKRSVVRTVLETVSIGIAAALAGVAIGVLVNHSFSG